MNGMSDGHAQPDPRAAATKVVEVLQEAGHTAYFAGGCVRDVLRGAEPKDYDVATDAPPEVVAQLFRKTRAVGQAFGVMLVRLMRCEVEVATFRTEWGYEDGRRPDHVEFSDAEHDAQRRDFTINGLFYDPLADRVIDYVGGQADLERKVIRAIGAPDERFGEDYLRMLRAVRFAARLGFAIDDATAAAIGRHADKLDRISRERVGMEVEMMLTHRSRAKAVGLLGRLRLDGPVLSEPATDAPTPVLEALAAEADYATALAAWVIDRHHPAGGDLYMLKAKQLADRWQRTLVLSNGVSDGVCAALRELPTVLRWGELGVARRKRLLARPDWARLEHLAEAYTGVRGGFDFAAMQNDATGLFEQGVAPEPLISGDDLVAAGYLPGPAFKRVLAEVYDAQLEGRVADRAEALSLMRQWMER